MIATNINYRLRQKQQDTYNVSFRFSTPTKTPESAIIHLDKNPESMQASLYRFPDQSRNKIANLSDGSLDDVLDAFARKQKVVSASWNEQASNGLCSDFSRELLVERVAAYDALIKEGGYVNDDLSAGRNMSLSALAKINQSLGIDESYRLTG